MPVLGKKSINDVVNKIGRKAGIPSAAIGGKLLAGKRIATSIQGLFDGGNKKHSDLER